VTTSGGATVEARLADAVHRHSPVPLHHQIKVAVLHGIEQGWLKPGQQLPGERALAEVLGVSLAPVRQAMFDLTKDGYVDRTRGKGTFVRDRKLVDKIQILGSFHSSMAGQGHDLTVTVLGSDVAAPPPVVTLALRLRGEKAWCLRRLALLDGDPVALLIAWLPVRYARGVRDRDLGGGSLYDALSEVHGIEMTSADNVVEVDRASLEDATLLGLSPGSAVLRVVGVTRGQDDTPVEYSDVQYRPESFRVAIESRRTASESSTKSHNGVRNRPSATGGPHGT
jgi:GntR family transcriptional regulator